MKQPPPGLPPAASAKWHTRRWTDALGYLRVRSLANPQWQRDIPWLVSWLRRESPPAGDPLREHYDQAITAARHYQQLIDRRGSPANADAAWDEVLAPIDAILEQRHHLHMDHVRSAAVSGDQVLAPGGRPGGPDHGDPWQTYDKSVLPAGWAYPLGRDRVREALMGAGAVIDHLSFSGPTRSLRLGDRPRLLLGVTHSSDAAGQYFTPKGFRAPGVRMTLSAVPAARRAAVGGELLERWLPDACSWAAKAPSRGNVWSAGDHHWLLMEEAAGRVEVVEN